MGMVSTTCGLITGRVFAYISGETARVGAAALRWSEELPEEGYRKGETILERLSRNEKAVNTEQTTESNSNEAPKDERGYLMKEARKQTYREFGDYVREAIQDPKLAAEYLNAAAKEEDRKVFMIALKNVIDVFGGLSNLARKANLNRANLHRALTGKGSVTLDTLQRTLSAAGFQIKFKPVKKIIQENIASGQAAISSARRKAARTKAAAKASAHSDKKRA